MPPKQVYAIADNPPYVQAPPNIPTHEWPRYRDSAIILDNGVSTMRAGWSNEDSPRFVFDNVSSKYRDRKSNTMVLLAGNESYVDHTSLSLVRTAFEGDVLTSQEPMENMLDYLFLKLGIPTDTIRHPIVMTESLANPRHSRSMMSELLFECYNVPSIAYGIDSLFAFGNSFSGGDGLVLSSSTSSSHIIPVLGGRGILSHAKKINWGGSQASEYMLKLLQLKYPTFPGRLNSYQSSMIYRDHCYHSADYLGDLRVLSDSTTLAASGRVIQFPFAESLVEEKTEEELARQAEKKKEATKRLQEQAARQRMEKLVQYEEELTSYTELKNSRQSIKKADYDKKLKDLGFTSHDDLEQYLKKIERSLKRARNKELGIEEVETKEIPTFPLIDVPDHMLNEEDLKEKRRQRLYKASYDARVRAKTERDQEKARISEAKRIDEEARTNNLAQWIADTRKQHESIMDKIKERKKKKEQLADRKSYAAQNRMKSITSLANEKKRKRGEKEDDFGKNDSDWAIYREIRNSEDSDDEEEIKQSLKEVEAKLLQYDVTFSIHDTSERLALRKHQLFNAFVRGIAPDDPIGSYDPDSMEQNSQLHVNIERIRVPEVIWQPHMAGIDQAGLGETLEHVLRQFDPATQARLVNRIFVTGGNTMIPNFDARLSTIVRPLLPVGVKYNIVRPVDPFLETWRGMAKWAGTSEFARVSITRAEYEEYGGEWIKDHPYGNTMGVQI